MGVQSIVGTGVDEAKTVLSDARSRGELVAVILMGNVDRSKPEPNDSSSETSPKSF